MERPRVAGRQQVMVAAVGKEHDGRSNEDYQRAVDFVRIGKEAEVTVKQWDAALKELGPSVAGMDVLEIDINDGKPPTFRGQRKLLQEPDDDVAF